jgi:hypothetical protein
VDPGAVIVDPGAVIVDPGVAFRAQRHAPRVPVARSLARSGWSGGSFVRPWSERAVT